MLFSSITFIYYFLPIVFALYFLLPAKFRNMVLLAVSLFSYFYGEPGYTLLLLFTCAVDYTSSLIINRYRGTKIAKYALICSIVIDLSLLGFFKYIDFFISTLNGVLHLQIPLLRVPLPLGISFFTFQAMSYTIDVYRGTAKFPKNPLNFITYVAFFPQLVAGPIVRYTTVAEELIDRTHSFENFAGGAKRFLTGLGKKVLIANILGELNSLSMNTSNQSVLFYWMAAVSFTLQIYFDFSGYSDMAIGLGRIFGFHFLENFNYPFISKSISEFWNRWHISLSTWFKEYLYIPLGGNRVSKTKWIRNILIVWLCTGFWHGASWNFILWGLYFGIILIAEKFFLLKIMKKIPVLFQHFYVILIVIISFVIFNAEDLQGIIICLKGMLGLLSIPYVNAEALYYLKSYGMTLLIATAFSTPLLKELADKLYHNFPPNEGEGDFPYKRWQKTMDALEPAFYIMLLLVCTAFLVDSSFNPFLYFRF